MSLLPLCIAQMLALMMISCRACAMFLLQKMQDVKACSCVFLSSAQQEGCDLLNCCGQLAIQSMRPGMMLAGPCQSGVAGAN